MKTHLTYLEISLLTCSTLHLVHVFNFPYILLSLCFFQLSFSKKQSALCPQKHEPKCCRMELLDLPMLNLKVTKNVKQTPWKTKLKLSTLPFFATYINMKNTKANVQVRIAVNSWSSELWVKRDPMRLPVFS